MHRIPVHFYPGVDPPPPRRSGPLPTSLPLVLLVRHHHLPLARLLNYTAISLAGTSRSAPVLAISPIFSTLLALIVLGEKPNMLIGLGILVTVLGMALILSEKRSDAA